MEQNILEETINSVIREVDILAKQKSINVVFPEKDTSHILAFDRNKIHQVMMNLLSNAIKFTDSGRQITIHTTAADDHILVSLSDEGIGIPEDEIDTVFDKFIQSSKTKTGAGGTGLGLAICKEIIEGHGGRIWAANNEGRGATFTYTIPLSSSANREA